MSPTRTPPHAADSGGPPRISVVVPCYRQAHFLGEALDSVLDSGVATELIVVDDGSPGDEVARVVRTRPGVRLIERPHQGVSAARNAGLAACRTRYVAFLDADDRLVPGGLAAGLACFDRRPNHGFVHGRYRFVTEDGAPAGQPGAAGPTGAGYLALVRTNYIGMLGAVVFRTDVVRSVGGFRSELAHAEDYDLLLRVARQHPMAAHPAVVAEYRRYRASASADAARMLDGVLNVLAAERRRVPDDAAARRAFDEGERFFKLFYGVRLVRQIAREGVLRGRLRMAVGSTRDLFRLLGPSLALVSLPPSVAVAAVRKARWIVRGWRLRRAALASVVQEAS